MQQSHGNLSVNQKEDIMMRPLITVSVVATIMVALMLGVPLQARAQGNQIELKSAIEPARLGYGSSEPVNLRFTLSNRSDTPLSVLKWHTPLEGFNYNMFAVAKDGKFATYIGRLVKRGTPQPDDYITLKPHEELSVVIDLSEGYDIHEAGTYSVTLKTTLLDVGLEKPTQLVAKAERVGLVPKQSLDSNTVTFRILEDRKVPRPIPFHKDVSAITPKLAKQPPIFRGCSTSQQTSLNDALTSAEGISGVAQFDLENTPLANRPNAQRYSTWFGSYDASRYSKVTSNFQQIHDALSNKTITFDCGCNNNWYAYVYPDTPYEIYLCNAFWSAPLTGTDSKAGTIVHESSHFYVVAGTTDHVYGQSGCQQLAMNNPSQAIENADSHEYFAENNPPLPMPTVVSACSLCYTCGGNWPTYSGTIGKIIPAPSYAPMERASGCSGSLQYMNDDHPYICCK
jgi:peptidyl-Lys metalloendopeptidase